MAPQEDGARPAGAEADAPTSTAASASTCASQATLMIRPSLPLRSDQVIEWDQRSFIARDVATLAAGPSRRP
jgi:hypothetical protein